MKNYFLIFCYIFCFSVYGQTITTAEYFIDTPPKVGTGTVVQLTPNSTIENAFRVTQNLDRGIHRFYIRVKSSEGIWSFFDYELFYVGKLDETNIVAFEYYIDDNEEKITIATTTPNNQTIMVPTTGLAQGDHMFYIRAKTATGTWSDYEQYPFKIEGFLSIDENIFNSIKLLPNPVINELTISSSKDFITKQVNIYNMLGEKVFESNLNQKIFWIKNLASGLYILNLKTNLGEASYKIVKN